MIRESIPQDRKRTVKVFAEKGYNIPELFNQWKDGDDGREGSYGLIAAFRSGVYAKIWDVIKDCKEIHNKREDVEELVQTVFIRMLESKYKLKEAYGLSLWLDKTAYHVALKHIYRMRNRKEISLDSMRMYSDNDQINQELVSDSPAPCQNILLEEQNRIVRESINLLPVKQQVVVKALISENGISGNRTKPRLLRTYAEVAKELGCSKSYVVKLSKHAQEFLKKIFQSKLLLNERGYKNELPKS